MLELLSWKIRDRSNGYSGLLNGLVLFKPFRACTESAEDPLNCLYLF
jgi:hypothetical protein